LDEVALHVGNRQPFASQATVAAQVLPGVVEYAGGGELFEVAAHCRVSFGGSIRGLLYHRSEGILENGKLAIFRFGYDSCMGAHYR
jgi:hypothetical protein